MAFEGMDPDLADTQLGQLNNQGVAVVNQVISDLSSLVGQIASNWVGPDSTKFQGDWNGQLTGALHNVENELQQFATRFQQNISQQRTASQ